VDQLMVNQLISALTSNKDLRQDLWVCYLSHEIDSTFSNKLQQLSLIEKVEQAALHNYQNLIDLEIPQDLLSELSDLQCQILFMTILGYTPEQVGRYNGVKQVVIAKEMAGLIQHPLWVQHGIKKAPKSRRTIRSD